MTIGKLILGQDVAELARDWVGTPYHHQATLKGVGCDCLGLVRGIYREVVGPEPVKMPNYSPAWDEVSKRNDMLNMMRDHLAEWPQDARGPGLVLVFRMRENAVPKHCGIMTTREHFVHSHTGRGTVEIDLNRFWQSHVVAVFSFPGVIHG